MKSTRLKTLFKSISCYFTLLSSPVIAEQITISSADSHPYKNLINRTGNIKIFYTKKITKSSVNSSDNLNTSDNSLTCKVEVTFDNTVWLSDDKKVSKENFNDNPLIHCLSASSAKQALLQSHLQFGRGL